MILLVIISHHSHIPPHAHHMPTICPLYPHKWVERPPKLHTVWTQESQPTPPSTSAGSGTDHARAAGHCEIRRCEDFPQVPKWVLKQKHLDVDSIDRVKQYMDVYVGYFESEHASEHNNGH